MLETIIIEPENPAKYCVIWLHGLGADGHDFENIVPLLNLPKNHRIRFVFPHAPYRSITLNMHMKMRAWYDIYALDNLDWEDKEGILQSSHEIENLMEHQKIDSKNIVLAGFSQGGAIALHLGINSLYPLGGVIALSTYLPFLNTKPPEIQHPRLPILQCHGIYDDIVPLRAGKKSYEYLKTKNHCIEWKEYPMAHQVCAEEIDTIGKWLVEQFY